MSKSFGADIEKGAMKEPETNVLELKKENFLSSGSVLINLSLTGRTYGAYVKGKYFLIAGDSTAGKTWLGLSALAEAARNRHFDDYDLIYDPAEDGNLIDIDTHFGEKTADRITTPTLDENGEPQASYFIEDFYFSLFARLKNPKPFVWVLDSMDGLTTKEEVKKVAKDMAKHAKGKDLGGSYGDGKAKINSQNLRRAVALIKAHGSILIIIAQLKDNMDPMGFEPKSRSGGKALRYYATAEFWLSLAGAFKKNVRGKNRHTGNRVLCRVKKNRITGQTHQVKTAIYPSYGLDDIGSSIDYLLEEKWWTKKKGVLNTRGVFGKLSKDKIIRAVESDEKGMKKLRMEVLACWKSIEGALKLRRKPRYA